MLEIRLAAVTHHLALRILPLRSFANSHTRNGSIEVVSIRFYRVCLINCSLLGKKLYEAASWIFLYASLTSSVSPYFFNHFETRG